MAKELVVYFSVHGTAKLVAEEIAKQNRNCNPSKSEVAWETTFDVLSCDMMGS